MTFVPLVKAKNFFVNTDVFALLRATNQGSYKIPDFQRDSSQWDLSKRSLFIESIINGFAIPPLIIYPEDDPVANREIYQVIDGQQRLTTIKDFVEGRFALANEDDVDYSQNIGALISNKKWDDLEPSIKTQIESYVLNFLVLPKDLDPMLRRNIFRRINEGGLPLSRHDLRLSDFGDSLRVYYIRLSGIFDQERPGSARMLKVAEKYDLKYPWKNNESWKQWWSETKLSQGQAPSEMFLYYLIAREVDSVNNLLESQKTLNPLRLNYDRTTASVLDIYCAQAKAEDISSANDHPQMLAPMKKIEEWFADFELWFNTLKVAKVPGIKVNSSTKIALFIAALSKTWPGLDGPGQITESQWEILQIFLTQGPGKILEILDFEYPISKGKWPGQKKQIERTFEICEEIKRR